jgi:hypothetical protein
VSAVVRLCGYTLSRLAYELLLVQRALDRELDKMVEGRRYDEPKLREALNKLEILTDVIRFTYPACPALRLEDVNRWKSDIVEDVRKLREAVEKGDEEKILYALTSTTVETASLFMRLYNTFIET